MIDRTGRDAGGIRHCTDLHRIVATEGLPQCNVNNAFASAYWIPAGHRTGACRADKAGDPDISVKVRPALPGGRLPRPTITSITFRR
ncbi:hypothetical protein MNVM_19420 [Mycobacterium novum]|uniref:Uncharacterized protein n=1 Tax=Mycobacterium novum TaxID=2492438 RepID=A0A7I7JNQ7_9MYCO|nr:hypothetical protein MNVM_19420 [Mycobacterium novum]